MALRIPVVTTRVSAIPELVDDEISGLLVDVDDAKAFARAVARVLDHPAQAQQTIENAAHKVATLFNQQANIDELLTYFSTHVPGRVVR